MAVILYKLLVTRPVNSVAGLFMPGTVLTPVERADEKVDYVDSTGRHFPSIRIYMDSVIEISQSEELDFSAYHLEWRTGVTYITPLAIRRTPSGFAARVGVALFGSSNMTPEEIAECYHDPFHERFRDNYVEGLGNTVEAAMRELNAHITRLSDVMWL